MYMFTYRYRYIFMYVYVRLYSHWYVCICMYIYIYVWITIPGLFWGILAITSEFWLYLLMFIWRKALVSPSGPQNAQFFVDNGLGHPKKIGNTFAVRLFVPPGSLLVNRVVQNSKSEIIQNNLELFKIIQNHQKIFKIIQKYPFSILLHWWLRPNVCTMCS